MGLIREVSLINRALEENKRLLTTKEEKQLQNNKLINDIKNECKAVLYDLLESDKEKDIIEHIDEIVGKISEYIINKKELGQVDYITNDGCWATKKQLINSYYIDDVYQLELVIKDLYIQEYKNILKLKKLNIDSKKEELQEQLIEKIRNILKLDKNIKGIFEQLEREEIKRDLIDEMTDDKDEKMFFYKIYYKTINELKKGYKYELKKYKNSVTLSDYYNSIKEESAKRRQQKKKTKGFGGFLLLAVVGLLKTGKKR